MGENSHKPVQVKERAMTLSKDKLRKILSERFDLEEVKNIYFDLDADIENQKSTTKDGLIRGLIRYLEDRNQLQELAAWIEDHRDDVHTAEFFVEANMPEPEIARPAEQTVSPIKSQDPKKRKFVWLWPVIGGLFVFGCLFVTFLAFVSGAQVGAVFSDVTSGTTVAQTNSSDLKTSNPMIEVAPVDQIELPYFADWPSRTSATMPVNYSCPQSLKNVWLLEKEIMYSLHEELGHVYQIGFDDYQVNGISAGIPVWNKFSFADYAAYQWYDIPNTPYGFCFDQNYSFYVTLN